MDSAARNAVRRSRSVLAVIVVAWGASLLLPALAVGGGPRLSGLDLLLQGWQGTSRGVYAWLANPLFAAAVAAKAMDFERIAFGCAGGAVLLGLTSFVTEDILRERMQSVPELTFLAGFWLWGAALLALFVWSSLTVYLQYRDHLRQ